MRTVINVDVRGGRAAPRLEKGPPASLTLNVEFYMDREKQPLRVGLVVGILGYASVIVLHAALDLIAGRGALYTVDLLGKSVFRGLRDPSVLMLPMEPDPMGIFLYNALHLAAAITIGLIVVGLVDRVERQPGLGRLALFTIVGGFLVTIVAVGVATSPIRPILPWWSIVVANLLAVIVGGSYLLWKWPDAWERLSPFGRG